MANLEMDPLDDTRVHPESYGHAIAIAQSAVGAADDSGEVAVENALAAPQVRAGGCARDCLWGSACGGGGGGGRAVGPAAAELWGSTSTGLQLAPGSPLEFKQGQLRPCPTQPTQTTHPHPCPPIRTWRRWTLRPTTCT